MIIKTSEVKRIIGLIDSVAELENTCASLEKDDCKELMIYIHKIECMYETCKTLLRNLEFIINRNDEKAEEIVRLRDIIKDAKIKANEFYKFGDPDNINGFLVELYEILEESDDEE